MLHSGKGSLTRGQDKHADDTVGGKESLLHVNNTWAVAGRGMGMECGGKLRLGLRGRGNISIGDGELAGRAAMGMGHKGIENTLAGGGRRMGGGAEAGRIGIG